MDDEKKNINRLLDNLLSDIEDTRRKINNNGLLNNDDVSESSSSSFFKVPYYTKYINASKSISYILRLRTDPRTLFWERVIFGPKMKNRLIGMKSC